MKMIGVYFFKILAAGLILVLSCSIGTAGVKKEVFENTLSVINTFYQTQVDSNINLEIISFWDDDQSNAYAAKTNTQYRVYIYGGIARDINITQDALALATCHELGHLFGGAPYPNTLESATSVEGQSDYYATNNCLMEVFKVLPSNEDSIGLEEPIMRDLCLEYSGSFSDCLRALIAMQVDANYMARNSTGLKPTLEASDPFETETTLLDYPETFQCRLDTMKAGLFNEPRPRCWFNAENTWIFNHNTFPPSLEKVGD